MPKFIARLIGPDDFVERKIFSTLETAKRWAKGPGLQAFEGDVAKAEVYKDGELVWWVSNPKDEDQWVQGKVAQRKAGIRWW